MAIASLYPTIKPSLLLDFANSKKLDPRVTFTRSTTATYYDGVTTAKAEENLLLQSQVFLPAPWTLTDADPTGTLGPELVTNGDFSSGSTGWTLGAGWSIVGGAASNDGSGAGQLRQTGLTYVAGKTYKITFAVTVAASAVNVVMETTNIGLVSSSGSYTFYFTANANAFNRIYFQPNGGYIGTIDDVSVKELTVTYVTAPDGTTTATELTADAANATFTQSVTAISAEYTFSVYLRRVTGTGNIDITCDSAGTWVTQTITSSWARYTVTQTLTAGTCTPGIRIVTSGDQIEVWGAQLEQRSAATAYTPTTTQPITNYVPQLLTAPANTPRFDHDVRPTLSGTGTVSGSTITLPTAFADGSAPSTSNDFYNGMAITVAGSAYTVSDYVGSTRIATLSGSPTTGSQVFSLQNPTTGESLGLLVEEQRTNLLLRSQEFDTTWATTNAAVTANAVVAPNGTLTAEKLIADATNNVHYVGQSVATTAITYTMTVYAKAAEYSFVRLFIDGSGNAYYNLATGALGTVGAGMTASITSVGNGWYRCSLSGVPQVASTSMRVYVANADNVAAYTGDGWSGIYIWGAQLEVGAFATSYIPTTSATVTRIPDLAVMAGSNFSSWYNAGEGTFYFEAIWSKPTTSQVYVLSSGSSGRYIYDSSSSASSMSVSSFDGTNVLGGGSGLSGFLKIVSSYSNASGTKQIASNGGTVYSGAYNGNFATNTTILFGETAFCGNFKKIAYYPQRLTDAQLQNLTK